MNKILFGGNFNPIHNGHINMANKASKQFDADVIFVPAVVSIWKSDTVDFNDKVEMIKRAIKPYKRMEVSLFEALQGKKQTYSIDTVKYFINKYKNDHFYLLIGNDQVNAFHKWKDADEIASLVDIIYYSRPNYDVDLNNVKRFKMQLVKGRENDTSSTDIRSLNNLDLPYDVLLYIEEKELYYIKDIKSMLKENRYKHSLEVAHLSYKIAIHNHLKEPFKAYTAGLAHDIGKDLAFDTQQEIFKTYFKDYLDMPNFAIHQFVGAYIAKNKFGIDDKDILEAIMFHASGKEKMNDIGKIVYSADKIEPTRGYDSKDMIEACLKDFEKGFVFVLEENRKFLTTKNGDIYNRLSKSCFEYYLESKVTK